MARAGQQFSNLHILMMIHYYCSPEPYAKHDLAHAGSQAVHKYREHLIRLGMLDRAPKSESGYQITEKGRAYVHELQRVPEPAQQWGYADAS